MEYTRETAATAAREVNESLRRNPKFNTDLRRPWNMEQVHQHPVEQAATQQHESALLERRY